MTLNENLLSERSNSSVTLVVEKIIEKLSEYVIIPNRKEIFDYLLQNICLVNSLPLICELTRECFGKDAQLSLELYKDPESDVLDLTLYVRHKNYTENIMPRIRKLRKECYNILSSKADLIHITTDFQPPK